MRLGAATALLVVVAACDDAPVESARLPAAIITVAGPTTTATVGASAGSWTVRVTDDDGEPIAGLVVAFAASLGGGRAEPAVDTTTADGTVATSFFLGTVPGTNQLSATVAGLAPIKTAPVTGVSGAVARVAILPGPLRFSATRNTFPVGAVTRDDFGNPTGPTVAWQSRNPALVTVTAGAGNNATVTVVSRPGQTWLVASASGVSDSVPVSVLAPGASPCLFAASPTTLAAGASITFDSPSTACIRSESVGAEFAAIVHYSAVTSASLANSEIQATGIVPVPLGWPPAPSAQQGAGALAVASEVGTSFEAGLRQRERSELPAFTARARAWYDSDNRSPRLTAALREGDVTAINVNAQEFCTNPDTRSMRVAAVTNSAIILADNGNPEGGFTDEEYREFGIDMDTLVQVVDTTAFGVPTDIDGNGRVTIVFTRAVNELTPRGASGAGIALGFFFSRDLLPRLGPTGSCPGSNVGEMFYVLVPDPAGAASDPRSKAFVRSIVVSTIAHEYQHLINASRRLYVNKAAAVTEEVWLNEALSHIAEELVFYRAAGIQPRSNIGAAQLQPGTASRAMFDTFQSGNFGRFLTYLRSPELNSPISSEDFLTTRGAAWAFLRYVADRAGTTDGDFWRRLVNSTKTGMASLDAELAAEGLTTLGLLRDWSVSILTDDALAVPGVTPQQPSWNFVSAYPAVGLAYALTPMVLTNDLTFIVALRSGGSSYHRFGVAQNAEALLQLRGLSGVPLPAGIRLTVVRTR